MLKIALSQISAILGDKEKNLFHIKSLCQKAADNKADFICFPEMATTGYTPALLGTKLWSLSEARGGETDVLFSQLANELNLIIVCGFVERGERVGQIYDSAGIWVPGYDSWRHVHRKIHLWGDEKKWFTEGNHCQVIETPFCRIGVMICYDIGFPEVARIFAMNNVDILFVPAAWPEYAINIWDINCAARALENGIHLVAVNHWGKEDEDLLFGGSQIISPEGSRIIRASENREDLVFGYIDFSLQAKTRLTLPYLKDMRVKFYKENFKE
ncbi:hydrolase [Candidatus Hamiltonella defensa]|uniref:Hydrolase n=1 Tax=Candidatus Williamhamiltonella defendens TaxID=138072 RepID=A0AAC9VM34_9ENTR|nr:nitrilase-related carbon-nitrogen hydrolase [Candidatus Hamiltonella defensa]ASV34477.1 hydrolase [Candidatus Hamiltonella defensa]AWK17433.1 hydrolase [Candidatus Hamiltonella defensa]MBK4361712.1 hydrolase [Candidatus Hamiltonella defensa]